MEKTSTERYELLRQMLIAERISAELKQAEVAARLQKPQSYISKIERGERKFDLIEFLEIATAIGFDPVKFLERLVKFNLENESS